MAISKESSIGLFCSSGDNAFITKLTEHLQANLNDDQFGVDSLAQAMGMSRSSLHRKLQKHLRISASRFIREYRLKKALEILKQENVTAAEAAYRVGFGSPTYFNSCFKKFYGFTPGEVKSQNIEDIDRLIEGESMINEKLPRAKKLFFGGMAFVFLAIVVFFYYSTTLIDNKPVERSSTSVNEKSIAVLPLKNWTGDPNLEYLSDGMTDALISRLTKINAIDKVIPFSSSLPYKKTKKTTKEVANELSVSNLLQGNLQIAGDQIKINLQLIDARTNDHLWSQEFIRDWESDEIFTIQAEVVENIAASMDAGIAKNELDYIKRIPTKSKQAYSYYLQAEFQRYKANEATFAVAIPLYEQALELDPNFVEAHLGLASIWTSGGMVWGIYDERTAWSNAKALLKRALEIDSTNQEVEEELYSGYFYYDWDFGKVEEYYQETSKKSFYEHTPMINTDYSIKTGRYKEAIKTIDKHLLTDPAIIGVLFCLKAEALVFLGRTEEAIELLDNSAIAYGDNWWYLRESAKQYFYLREYEKSKNQLKKLLTQFPDYPPILMWLNAVYAEMDGNTEKATEHLAELRQKYENGSSGSPAWFIALYYCTTEDFETTFDWLQKSYDRHEVEMTWLREEPLLAPIRNDSRYETLYRKVGFSDIGLPIKTPSKKNIFTGHVSK